MPIWTFLTQIWVNDVTAAVKTVIIWENNFRNILITSNFLHILILIFLSPSIHDILLWALFTQLRNNSVTKKIFQIFEKIIYWIGFDLLKMQMAGIAEVSIVASSRHIRLKLFWRTLENDVVAEPLFHTFHPAFYKNFVILVFWNKYSTFVPIFITINWKLGPI